MTMNDHTDHSDHLGPHDAAGALPSDDLHRRVWQLVPWVVAGGGSAAERASVLEHVVSCERCAEELSFHRRLHAAMQVEPAAEAVPDVEVGLARLLARLPDSRGDATAPAAPRVAHVAAGTRTARSGWTRWLAAAVMVQAVGLAALSSLLWTTASDTRRYLVHGDPAGAPAHAAPTAAPSVRLVTSPEMTVGALQGLLADAGLSIVESRVEPGVFGLAVSSGGVPDETALAVLRAAPGVKLVSRLGGAAASPSAPPPQ
jgi:hypothetical protein